MEQIMGAAGESQRFNAWFKDIYCSKRPGVIGLESFLDNFYEPASYAYYSERVRLGEWYHEHGSELLDHTIITRSIAMGALGMHSYLSKRSYLKPSSPTFPSITAL